MTKKDFELIAEAIRVTRNECIFPTDQAVINVLVDNLCANLRQSNPRFDAARFAAACKGGAQ